MIEFPVVLVINCGSSSIKFSVMDADSQDVLMMGIAEGVNTGVATLRINENEPVELNHQDYECALGVITDELDKRQLLNSVTLIGHRIAHGGRYLASRSSLPMRLLNLFVRYRRWLRCTISPT